MSDATSTLPEAAIANPPELAIGNLPTEATGTQPVKIKKPRNSPVGRESLFNSFFAACLANLTLNQLAEQVKMKPGSLQQRISEFRTEYAAEVAEAKKKDPNYVAAEFPSLKDGREDRQGTVRNKPISSLFAALQNAQPVAPAAPASEPAPTA